MLHTFIQREIIKKPPRGNRMTLSEYLLDPSVFICQKNYPQKWPNFKPSQVQTISCFMNQYILCSEYLLSINNNTSNKSVFVDICGTTQGWVCMKRLASWIKGGSEGRKKTLISVTLSEAMPNSQKNFHTYMLICWMVVVAWLKASKPVMSCYVMFIFPFTFRILILVASICHYTKVKSAW